MSQPNCDARDVLVGLLSHMVLGDRGKALIFQSLKNHNITCRQQAEPYLVEDGVLFLNEDMFARAVDFPERLPALQALVSGMCALRHSRADAQKMQMSIRDRLTFEKLCRADKMATTLQVVWEMAVNRYEGLCQRLYHGEPRGSLRHAAHVFGLALQRDGLALKDGRARRQALAGCLAVPDVETMHIERQVMKEMWPLRHQKPSVNLLDVVQTCFSEDDGATYLANRRGQIKHLQTHVYRNIRLPAVHMMLATLDRKK